MQTVHLNENGVLRCDLALVLPGDETNSHMLVYFVDENINKLYNVFNWDENLQDDLEEDIDKLKKTELDYD